MVDLGPHASFIVAAYGVTILAVAGLVLATISDDLKQRRLLAALERQGIKRRSAAKTATKTTQTKTAAKKQAAKRKSAGKAASPAKRKTSS